MSKDFAILKQKWTDQAMADKALPRAAVVAIYRLAFGYLNSKTGDCYPGQDTLAADIGVSRRQLQNLLAVLVERGHLEVIRVGKKAVNRYRPIIRDAQYTTHHNDVGDTKPAAHHEEPSTPTMRNSGQSDTQSIAPATRNELRIHSNLSTEPLEEPLYPAPLEGSGDNNRTYSLEETFFQEEIVDEDRALKRATSRPDDETNPVKPPVYQQGEAVEIEGYRGYFDVEYVFIDRIIAHSSYSDETIMFDLNEDGSIDPTRTLNIETTEEYEHAIG